jgi:hypothetical protein
MTNGKCWENLLAEILNNLPTPLIEPVWFPGVPKDKDEVKDLLARLGELLLWLVEQLVNILQKEGFFDENPLIRVYPNYPDASGIVIFYKGRKVFERWINTFEMNWRDKQTVKKEVTSWYDEMHRGMGRDYGPEDVDFYLDEFVPPWERVHPWERNQ